MEGQGQRLGLRLAGTLTRRRRPTSPDPPWTELDPPWLGPDPPWPASSHAGGGTSAGGDRGGGRRGGACPASGERERERDRLGRRQELAGQAPRRGGRIGRPSGREESVRFLLELEVGYGPTCQRNTQIHVFIVAKTPMWCLAFLF